MRTAVALLLALFLGAPFADRALAADLLMARSERAFPEAMVLLQDAIASRGYTITRLQQVNENLERSHYRSDLYRVVFFGKHAEVRRLAADYPMLIPFLPLQVTIFAEGDQAIVVAADPLVFAHLYPDPALRPVFETWARDLRAILDAVRE